MYRARCPLLASVVRHRRLFARRRCPSPLSARRVGIPSGCLFCGLIGWDLGAHTSIHGATYRCEERKKEYKKENLKKAQKNITAGPLVGQCARQTMGKGYRGGREVRRTGGGASATRRASACVCVPDLAGTAATAAALTMAVAVAIDEATCAEESSGGWMRRGWPCAHDLVRRYFATHIAIVGTARWS